MEPSIVINIFKKKWNQKNLHPSPNKQAKNNSTRLFLAMFFLVSSVLIEMCGGSYRYRASALEKDKCELLCWAVVVLNKLRDT